MADERLFSPLVVGGQELKNRMVLAPMTRARCEPTPEDDYDIKNSLPTDMMRDYYVQRASAGLLITEGTQVSELGTGWMCAPKIEKEEHAEAWKKVTDGVHENDGVIYCQLWHLVSFFLIFLPRPLVKQRMLLVVDPRKASWLDVSATHACTACLICGLPCLLLGSFLLPTLNIFFCFFFPFRVDKDIHRSIQTMENRFLLRP